MSGVEVRRHDSYSCFSARAGDEPFARDDGALTSKERSYLRSLVRRGADRDFEVLSVAHGQAFPREELCRLRREMISSKMRSEGFFPRDVMDHIENVYQAGLCEISVLRKPDRSFEYAAFRILNARSVNFWIVLYLDKRDVTTGDVLYMRDAVRRLSDGETRRQVVFDFGTGVYRYKVETFRPRIRHLYSIFSRTPWHPTVRSLVKEEVALLRKYARVWLGRESEKERERRVSLYRYA